jgi:hypothetical protein
VWIVPSAISRWRKSIVLEMYLKKAWIFYQLDSCSFKEMKMAGAKRRARVACLVIAVTRLSKQLNTCDWKCITKALPPKPVAVLGADHSNRGSCSLRSTKRCSLPSPTTADSAEFDGVPRLSCETRRPGKQRPTKSPSGAIVVVGVA